MVGPDSDLEAGASRDPHTVRSDFDWNGRLVARFKSSQRPCLQKSATTVRMICCSAMLLVRGDARGRFADLRLDARPPNLPRTRARRV